MLRHDELTIISRSKDLFREAHKFFVWENCVFISKVELWRTGLSIDHDDTNFILKSIITG